MTSREGVRREGASAPEIGAVAGALLPVARPLDGRAHAVGVRRRGHDLEVGLELVGRALILPQLPVDAAEVVVRPGGRG